MYRHNMYEEDEECYEDHCLNITNTVGMYDDCTCGFENGFYPFPENPMLAQSYVPIQMMSRTFRPSVGLKMGTIFPELVSPYMPCQSMEEIEYLRRHNETGEGCNR